MKNSSDFWNRTVGGGKGSDFNRDYSRTPVTVATEWMKEHKRSFYVWLEKRW